MISNLCYKNNTSKIKKQDSNLKIHNPVPHRLIQSDIENFLNNLSEGYRKVFNVYLWFQNRTKDIYVSQAWVSRKTDLSRKHVNVIVKNLCLWGLLYKWNRYMETCLYSVSSFFFKPEIRKKLSYIFSALIQLPLSWLMASSIQSELSPLNQYSQPEVTLIKGKNLFINSSPSNTSYTSILLERDKAREDYSEQEKVTTRKKESMNEEKKLNIPLSEAKALLKNRLNLTDYGVIDIHKFDDRAIIFALGKIKPSKNKEIEYVMFCKEAHQWHKDNGVMRRYQDRDFLEKTFPIPAGAKMTFEAPKKDYSSRNKAEDRGLREGGNKFHQGQFIHPEPLAGTNPDVVERIKARREAIVNKTYNPPTETREEAFQKVEEYGNSEAGREFCRRLGFNEYPNPFKENTSPLTTLKEIFIKGEEKRDKGEILNILNLHHDRQEKKIIEPLKQSPSENIKTSAQLEFEGFSDNDRPEFIDYGESEADCDFSGI